MTRGIANNTTFAPTAQVDASQRLRVSESNILSSLVQDKSPLPLRYYTSLTGTGQSTHSTARASSVLSVSATNDEVIRQSKYNQYTAEHSQMFTATFTDFGPQDGVIKEVGYYDAANGVFLRSDPSYPGSPVQLVLRSSVSGSPVDTIVPQSLWSFDTYKTVDWDKIQVFSMDMLWLGGGFVRCKFHIADLRQIVHVFEAANEFDSVYMSTASLPVRYRIKSTGGAGQFEQICASVVREGGGPQSGIQCGKTYFNSSLTATSTERSCFALKLRSGYEKALINVVNIGMQMRTAGDAVLRIYLNPTMASSLTYANAGNISATSATQVNYSSGGHLMSVALYTGGGSGGITTGGNMSDGVLRLSSNIAGAADELVMTVQNITGTDQIDTYCEWVEYY